VSEELGVRYVLEGSVQRSADRVRITAQLIDALAGHHLWAERYDRDLKEIFALQDEITMKIISALQVKLTVGEMAHLVGKGTKNLDAYLKALQANEQYLHQSKQGSTMAKQLAKEAITLDPKYAFPYTIIAHSHILDVYLGFSESPEESMKLAFDAAEKALALDDSDPGTHACFARLYAIKKQHDKAIASAKRALELGPGEARAHFSLGGALMHACRFSEAIQYQEEAIRLDPFAPSSYIHALSASYRFVGRYEEALGLLKKAHKLEPNNLFTHLGFAQIYGTLGRAEEARAAAAEVLRLNPNFSLERYAKTIPLKDQSAVDFIIGGLRKAGLK
jgi:adenylate cyclase